MALAGISAGAVLLSPQARAGREGNGGDGVALRFTMAGQKAIQAVLEDPNDYPELAKVNLKKTLDQAKILITDQPLTVRANGVNQSSVAINHPNQDLILINREAWNRQSPQVQQGLALHEILGLLGIESTGRYAVTQRFLMQEGLSCDQSLCAGPPVPAGEFTFDGAVKAFQSARIPTAEQLEGKWLTVGLAQDPSLTAETTELPPEVIGYFPDGRVPMRIGYYLIYLGFHQGSDIFGNPGMSVEWSEIGNETHRILHHQGPFEMRIRPNGACFAMKAYTPSGSTSDQYYDDYVCRLTQNGNLLLCAEIVNGSDPKLPESNPQHALVGKVEVYSAYKRVSP